MAAVDRSTPQWRAPNTSPRFHARFAWAVFLLTIAQRLLQWLLLQPALQVLAQNNPDFQVMQLLPRALWRTHFADALLYLQQTPPVPNILFGLAAITLPDLQHESAAMILTEGLLHAISAVLVFRLLLQFFVPLSMALAVTVLFIFNIDFLVMEYSVFGQLFYEPLAMCLCLCAACCAVTLARKPSGWIAFAFGITIAGLALTRASFSYFFLPAAVWFAFTVFPWLAGMGDRHRLRLCALFVLPIAILHGGWACKQWLVQGQFSWATSSWGGLNIQSGELKRFFANYLKTDTGDLGANTTTVDALVMDADCLAQWRHIKPAGFFAVNQLVGPQPENAGASIQAQAVDISSALARQTKVDGDSAAVREYSQCLQQAYVAFWLKHPNQLLMGWWQSYGVFWAAISDFAEIYPMTLVPEQKRWDKPAQVPSWQPGGELFSSRPFLMRQDKYPYFYVTYDASTLRPVTLLAIPVVPAMFSTLAMVLLHLAPIACLLLRARDKDSFDASYAGLSFLMLTYLYLALIGNIGEHGENMRFRVVVEPLVWCIAATVLAQCWRWVRSFKIPSPSAA